MESTWSAGLNFQPTSYWSEEKTEYGSQNNSGFSFVDFLPECRSSGGFCISPEYDSFQTVIDRANDWLRANRKWKIKTCETVEFKADRPQVDSSKMSYIEHRERLTSYVRGLRLWLAEREHDSEREQQIGFLNLTPREVKSGGIFSSASFETLDEVIENFNSMIKSNPLPGRVITIESQEMKLPNWSNLEPDRSYWIERGDMAKHFLFIIRIFYEIMAANPEEIGVKDFVPDEVAKGGIFSHPAYEPFSNAVKKASDWCSRQQGIRFCNAQSLEIKVSRGKNMTTQKMDYTEYGSGVTCYLRIVRIAYTKLPTWQHSEYEYHLPQLTCKSFMPVLLKKNVCYSEYETLEETKERVTAWVKATGARVLSAETAALRTVGYPAHLGPEATYCTNQTYRVEYWIFVIRLYLHGIYNEPPPEMLPPVPELQSQDCCGII